MKKTILPVSHASILIVVLVACTVWFLYNEKKINELQHTYGYITTLYMPRDTGSYFNAHSVLQENSKRKMVEYILKGDAFDDTKIALMRQIALQARHSCDTSMWIKIHLRDNVTYGEFMRLVNYMNIDCQYRYMVYKKDFYIIPAIHQECEEELHFHPLLL